MVEMDFDEELVSLIEIWSAVEDICKVNREKNSSFGQFNRGFQTERTIRVTPKCSCCSGQPQTCCGTMFLSKEQFR